MDMEKAKREYQLALNRAKRLEKWEKQIQMLRKEAEEEAYIYAMALEYALRADSVYDKEAEL